MNQVTVVIPTRSSPLVGNVIEETKNEFRMASHPGPNFIIAGYRSPISTQELANGDDIQYIEIKERGKTAAIRQVQSILQTHITIMLDADTTYPAMYMLDGISKIYEGADVVMGIRQSRERGAMKRVNLLGNKGLSLLASLLYGYWVKDVCTGFWCFRTDKLREFTLTSGGFQLEADLFINSMKTKAVVKQIPIHYRAQPEYKKGIGIREGLHIGLFMAIARLKK